jgi:hypothetical protein
MWPNFEVIAQHTHAPVNQVVAINVPNTDITPILGKQGGV